MKQTVFLSGERPIGRRYGFEALRERFLVQEEGRCLFMIADYQALAAAPSGDMEMRVQEIVLDYLAAGFNPGQSVCFLQSQVPQLAELAVILGHLAELSRLTGRMGKPPVTYGDAGYSILQAADILLFRPDYVPVPQEERPHVELARELAARFNEAYGSVFPLPVGRYVEVLEPGEEDAALFRERRERLMEKKELVRGLLYSGGSQARVAGQRTLEAVKEVMGLKYGTLLG